MRRALPGGVREQTGNAAADRMQRTGIELARALQSCPFLVGKPKRVRLVAGVEKVVNHRLGAPAAFIVIRNAHGSTAVQEALASFQQFLNQDHQMAVVSSTDCVVDLWFYPRLNLTEE